MKVTFNKKIATDNKLTVKAGLCALAADGCRFVRIIINV